MLPANWPDPNSLRQLNPDHDERYRGVNVAAQGVGVEDLAACGSPALEARPIPGGRAALTMPLYLSVPLIVIRIELS